MREDIKLAAHRHLTLSQLVDQQLRELIPVTRPPPFRIAAHQPPRFTLQSPLVAHASASVFANRRSPTSATRRWSVK